MCSSCSHTKDVLSFLRTVLKKIIFLFCPSAFYLTFVLYFVGTYERALVLQYAFLKFVYLFCTILNIFPVILLTYFT